MRRFPQKGGKCREPDTALAVLSKEMAIKATGVDGDCTENGYKRKKAQDTGN